MLIDSYKANAIRIRLVPLHYGYQIFFDEEPFGRIVPDDGEGWRTDEALFHDENLVVRLGMAIDAAIS